MVPSTDKLSVQNLLRDYSIEATAHQAKRVQRFGDLLAGGTRVYIPHSPRTDFPDIVALAVRLRREGMEPVPHIVARRIPSVSTLNDLLKVLSDSAGVTQALVVAGDLARPAGEFHSSLQILESGLLEKHRIRTVGVAGHPEGHREIKEAMLRDALKRKNSYAEKTGASVYVITQFTFSADPIIAWERLHGPDICRLPVIAGIPGPATATTLLKYATECGVGVSLQAFSKRYASITKLLTISAPDETIVGLAGHRARMPQSRLAGVHFFTFGELNKTAQWANHILTGSFELTEHERLVLT